MKNSCTYDDFMKAHKIFTMSFPIEETLSTIIGNRLTFPTHTIYKIEYNPLSNLTQHNETFVVDIVSATFKYNYEDPRRIKPRLLCL